MIPLDGGISLDLTRMDASSLDPADLTATAQPGVTRTSLERATAEHGLFFPSTPGPTRRSGGWPRRTPRGRRACATGRCAPTRSRSRRCSRRPVVRAGSRAPKTSAGYDLLGLLDRLGGDARGDHRADAPPPGDSRARRRRPALVPRCRVRVPGGGDDRRRGRRRDAGRASRRLDDHGRSTRTRGRTSPRARRSSSKRPGRRARWRPTWSSSPDRRVRGSARRRRRARPDGAHAALGGRHASAYATAAAAPGQAPSLDGHLRPALGARRRRLVRAAGARATRARRRRSSVTPATATSTSR